MRRIHSFDLLRLLLVLFALTSHLMLHQEWQAFLSDDAFIYIRVVTRTAMPGLLIVFGFMMYYVYFTKIMDSLRSVVFRISGKMALCYFAFLTLSFVGLIAEANRPVVFLGSIVLVAPATYADLFKYYFFLFPLALFMLVVIHRMGWKGAAAIVGALWSMAEALKAFLAIPYVLSHVGGLFFGIEDAWGPSIAHSSVLLLFGMSMAHAFMRGWQFDAGLAIAVATLLASMCIIGAEVSSVGWLRFMESIVDYEAYRATNALPYYAYAVLMFVLLFLGCSGVMTLLSAKRATSIAYFGRHTFALFLIGNALILMLPSGAVTRGQAMAYAIFVLASSLCLTYLFREFLAKKSIWLKTTSALQTPFLHLVQRLVIEKFPQGAGRGAGR